jgi:serine O-acetyltransferase
MLNRLKEDVRTIFAKDPAARTVWEILCCYPGLHAIWFHRLAHALWVRGFRFLARLVSHVNRALTGVEIHPGAQIGRRFFVDHGMGVVIGETAEIGHDVLMYQGVVLGGTSLERTKRHPTIGDNVVIGADATILGPITVGDGARIGAGSVVIKPVPPGTTVVGVPGHIAGLASSTKSEADVLEHGQLPDPVLRTLSEILQRQSRLEEKLGELERTVPRVDLPQLVGGNGGSDGRNAENAIRQALRDVIDPEVGVNVVDLGLIREIKGAGENVIIRMVLTYPAHPMAGYLVEQVRRKARRAADGRTVEVVLLDEAWRWEDREPHLRSGGGI